MSLIKSIHEATLELMIERLPVLDLTWPDEWQSKWWGWFDQLMRLAREIEAAVPKEPTEEMVNKGIDVLLAAALDDKDCFEAFADGLRAALAAAPKPGGLSPEPSSIREPLPL